LILETKTTSHLLDSKVLATYDALTNWPQYIQALAQLGRRADRPLRLHISASRSTTTKWFGDYEIFVAGGVV
jgi:hypothetical protein